MYFEKKDAFDYGSIYLIRTVKPKYIEIPLSILTKQQLNCLHRYLDSEDLIPDDKEVSRLAYHSHGAWKDYYRVECITLSKEQKELFIPKVDRKENSFKTIDFNELLEALNKNELTWLQIKDIFDNLHGRPWGTTEWRKKRAAVLGTTCAICNESEGTLTLQHTRQPRKFETVINDYKRIYRQELDRYLNRKPLHFDLSQYPKDQARCPKCHSPVIRYRKTKKSYICTAIENKQKCGHVFTNPKFDVSYQTIRALKKEELLCRTVDFFNATGLGQQVAKVVLTEMIEYLNLKNVKTLCKKCAFMEDKTDLILCKICAKVFHKKGYSCCSYCEDLYFQKLIR